MVRSHEGHGTQKGSKPSQIPPPPLLQKLLLDLVTSDSDGQW